MYLHKDDEWSCGFCELSLSGKYNCGRCILPILMDLLIGFDDETEVDNDEVVMG